MKTIGTIFAEIRTNLSSLFNWDQLIIPDLLPNNVDPMTQGLFPAMVLIEGEMAVRPSSHYKQAEGTFDFFIFVKEEAFEYLDKALAGLRDFRALSEALNVFEPSKITVFQDENLNVVQIQIDVNFTYE